ncbi:MAG: efflux RND transporter periplasmic adaptor subunit [Planctomycetaceae bacterium]|nr:efflux RND transporter periplasmic adaptor subunit [Planctomycetaceae bacterium]
MDRSNRVCACLTIGIALSLLSSGCDHSRADPASMKLPPATVIVSQPVAKQIVDYVDFTGRTDAAETIEIRAKVTGFLDTVTFVAGSEVDEGVPLYQIDSRQYNADLDAAKAALASSLAAQDKATTDFKRMEELKKRGAASQEEFDRTDAARKEADADVQSASAKVERAQLDVGFTKIAAPIFGKISRTLVDKGNLVNADTTKLTTLVSVDPMFVYFDVEERTMLTIEQQVRDGTLESRESSTVVVLLGLATDDGYPHRGTLDFIDNRVDPNTGTKLLRGVFANPKPAVGERILTPGLFARVRVPIGKPHSALLVNERAIGTDQGQKFVYVVNDNNEVVFRPVRLGAKHDGLRVVAEGVQSGDAIIIDGLQRVRPGAVVKPKPGDMRSRPGDAVATAADDDKSPSQPVEK